MECFNIFRPEDVHTIESKELTLHDFYFEEVSSRYGGYFYRIHSFKDGDCVVRTTDNIVYKMSFKDGEMNGLYESFYENGQLSERKYFIDGKQIDIGDWQREQERKWEALKRKKAEESVIRKKLRNRYFYREVIQEDNNCLCFLLNNKRRFVMSRLFWLY